MVGTRSPIDRVRFKKEVWTMGQRNVGVLRIWCWMGSFGPRRSLVDLMRKEKGKEGFHMSSHRFLWQMESATQTRQVQEEAASSESPSLLSGHTNAGDAMTVSLDTIAGVSELRLLGAHGGSTRF